MFEKLCFIELPDDDMLRAKGLISFFHISKRSKRYRLIYTIGTDTQHTYFFDTLGEAKRKANQVHFEFLKKIKKQLSAWEKDNA